MGKNIVLITSKKQLQIGTVFVVCFKKEATENYYVALDEPNIASRNHAGVTAKKWNPNSNSWVEFGWFDLTEHGVGLSVNESERCLMYLREVTPDEKHQIATVMTNGFPILSGNVISIAAEVASLFDRMNDILHGIVLLYPQQEMQMTPADKSALSRNVFVMAQCLINNSTAFQTALTVFSMIADDVAIGYLEALKKAAAAQGADWTKSLQAAIVEAKNRQVSTQKAAKIVQSMQKAIVDAVKNDLPTAEALQKKLQDVFSEAMSQEIGE